MAIGSEDRLNSRRNTASSLRGRSPGESSVAAHRVRSRGEVCGALQLVAVLVTPDRLNDVGVDPY